MMDRILYIAPRYHTNQVPIMKGWHGKGVTVYFIAQFEGISEIHDFVEFRLMKKSWISKLYKKLFGKQKSEFYEINRFIPSFFHLYRLIKEADPQCVIIRERSLSNAMACMICRIQKVKKVILYNQTPLYKISSQENPIKRIIKKIVYPQAVFSPVLYTGEKPNANILQEHTYFVPLITEVLQTENRIYCKDGILRIIDVGKYRDYKNHFYLTEALIPFKHRKDLKVTIIGQRTSEKEYQYYHKLKSYIQEKGLAHLVELRSNIPFREMNSLYEHYDALILPSKHESAGMVILEAMGNGLCVAAGNQCGLSCYLTENQCGEVFGLHNSCELSAIIGKWLKDKRIVRNTGNKAKQVVKENYSFQNYERHLTDLIAKEFPQTKRWQS